MGGRQAVDAQPDVSLSWVPRFGDGEGEASHGGGVGGENPSDLGDGADPHLAKFWHPHNDVLHLKWGKMFKIAMQRSDRAQKSCKAPVGGWKWKN
jgi:hypothetical protein